MLRRLYYWWMEKVLDRHVCKEFTQWTEKTEVWDVYPSPLFNQSSTAIGQSLRRYQERRCTICGRLYRERIC